MKEAILSTLSIIGWLGIILGILALVNIVTGTLINIWDNHENFNSKKMIKGIVKVVVFYFSAAILSIAFTMLPYINEMISDNFGVILLSKDLLNTLSSIGVLGVVCSTIAVQGKKAIEGILSISGVSSSLEDEEITWEVEEEKEDE